MRVGGNVQRFVIGVRNKTGRRFFRFFHVLALRVVHSRFFAVFYFGKIHAKLRRRFDYLVGYLFPARQNARVRRVVFLHVQP